MSCHPFMQMQLELNSVCNWELLELLKEVADLLGGGF